MPNNNTTPKNPIDDAKAATAAALAQDDNTAVADDDAATDAVSSFLAMADDKKPVENTISGEKLTEVAKRIAEAHNVLIALSSDPSVDELAAAIGVSIYLDKLGKKATAIYSGSTPNALEFLKPEETFENSADVLQDFVIAINKDKADHLRYKLDGSYVKIYITPYKSKIEESDFEFSYGDYNVDLVLALDVANGIDLDEALREHGRIMHDAIIVNITTGKPGKFGEIEWSEPKASSISEIIANLSYAMGGKQGVGKEEATAYLTGIVAATNRFSNAKTTAATMHMASRLMESGANQQLVAKNITPDVDNELFFAGSMNAGETNGDPTKLDIGHEKETGDEQGKEIEAEVQEKESTLLDDLKAAEAALAGAGTETVSKPGEVLPNVELGEEKKEESAEEPAEGLTEEPVEEPTEEAVVEEEPTAENTEATPAEEEAAPASAEEPVAETVTNSGFLAEEPKVNEEEVIPGPQIPTPGSSMPKKEVVVTPPEDLNEEKLSNPEPNRFEQMMAEALGEGVNPAAAMAPKVNVEPAAEPMPEVDYGQVNGELVPPKIDTTNTEDDLLPPPPAPEMPAAVMPEMPAEEVGAPVLPTVEAPAPEMPAPEIEPAPEAAPVAAEPANDPAAFKIPGL